MEGLANFKPSKPFIVGIDSDGCAFDTMELKHKECFIPNIIKHWNLQPISKVAREAAEFVNLYSTWRGINRFPALVKTIDLLADRPIVTRRAVQLPDLMPLRAFIDSNRPLSNAGLQVAIAESPNPILMRALEWSQAVNQSIEAMVQGVPPFPLVRDSLERLAQQADIVVVSATPREALVREWHEHGISSVVRVVCGQEAGSKKNLLTALAKMVSQPERLLMMGDAPGDYDAARAANAAFFPINPGDEERSWEEFYHHGLERFLSLRYVGADEATRIAKFKARLPEQPPWKD